MFATAAVCLWFSPAAADLPTRDDPRLQPSAESTKDTGRIDTSTKARSQSSGGLKCSVSRQDMTQVLNGAADRYGLPRQYLENAAVVESRCNPNAGASGSSAKGLGQFINGTWKAYGNGQDVYDPEANADAMARLTKDDVTQLQRKLGRSPTFEEGYLAHQQGIGGASCLLKNPSAPATSCVSAAAVTGNGGSVGMTGGQFSSLVEGYYKTGSLSGARTAVANYDATGSMPNSGNFADGSNGTGSATGTTTAGAIPPLKRTIARTSKISDEGQTSTAATGYSTDLGTTQRQNLALLQQRSAAIGSGDRVQDAIDMNSRLRADQIQLRQEAGDVASAWGSLVTSSLMQSVARQSQVATAMVTSGGPAPSRSGDIMPGIPSPIASTGGCTAVGATGQSCAARISDNPLNVSAYLAHFAAGSTVPSATSASISALPSAVASLISVAAQAARASR